MRVLHVIETISRTSGGPARSCQGLVAALCAVGVDASLFSLKPGERPWVEGIGKYFNNVAIEDVLLQEKPDIVHIHDLWRPELHRSAVVCRRLGVPYVISPRGMLESWSLRQKWLKKRIARLLYQDGDLKCAVALHATAKSEAEQFRKLGFKNPIIVSPNGVNVPSCNSATKNTNGAKRVLFVSRMHPKKGVLELVEAWGRISRAESQSRRDRWMCELVYTVSGELERKYEAKVKARVTELGLEETFIFTGALNDDEKWQAYGRADLFVLPTYSENFGIVVAEALWAGLPVITTKGTPWAELEKCKCGWWIDIGVESLVRALREATALPVDTLCAMGGRGRELAESQFTWDAVAKKMYDGYREVLGRAEVGMGRKG